MGFAALHSLSLGQSFNLDVGDTTAISGNGSPSATYGAGADSPGNWTFVDVTPHTGSASFTTPPLADITGTSTPVTLTFSNVNANDFFLTFDFDEATATGDDALLMEDILFTTGEAYEMTFEGLVPGDYLVYTYANAPESALLATTVDVAAGTGGPQAIAGAFPATGHAQGITYALHAITVDSSGEMVIAMEQSLVNDSLNGIQLVLEDPSAAMIGTNYCDQTAPNTTGGFGQIAAFGSLFAADNILTLTSTNVPNNEFTFFIASQTQGFIGNPNGSQGNLCILGNLVRFNRTSEIGVIAGETFSLAVDLTDVPEPNGTGAILAGETWSFQGWHRDFLPGSGPTSHFTNGVVVTFQ